MAEPTFASMQSDPRAQQNSGLNQTDYKDKAVLNKCNKCFVLFGHFLSNALLGRVERQNMKDM